MILSTCIEAEAMENGIIHVDHQGSEVHPLSKP